MKAEIIMYIIGALAVIALVGILMFTTRWFAQQVTPINVVEVEPGVHCAQMITSDGAAIDCWKVAND